MSEGGSQDRGGAAVLAAGESGALGRREVLRGGAVLLGALLLPAAGARAQGGFELAAETRAALEKQPLVYISPLRKDGKESRCHGEVWYFIDQGDVVIGTDPARWKARAVQSGRDRARIWVPKSSGAQGYKDALSFEARARLEPDRAVFDRLFERFAAKYGGEWDTWGPRFRDGYADGTRVVLRYTPVGA
jgi:hypothetical protein